MNLATTTQCLIPHDHAHPSPLAPPGTGHKQHEGHLRRLHGEESRIEIHKTPGSSMVSELRDVPASREHTQRFDVAGNPRNLCSFVFVTDVFQPRRAREVAKSRSREVARLPGCQVAAVLSPASQNERWTGGRTPFLSAGPHRWGRHPGHHLVPAPVKAQRVARRSALAEFSFDVDTAVAQQQRQDAVAGAHHAFEVLNALADKFFFGSQLALAAL